MVRLEEEISKLKKMLFEMATSVEEMIAKSIKALKDRNMIMAEEVIKSDAKINEMEIDIDNQCIKILALHHPEAEDLRTVSMIMKINNDLERIGDHAVNIAEKRFISPTSRPSNRSSTSPGWPTRRYGCFRKASTPSSIKTPSSR